MTLPEVILSSWDETVKEKTSKSQSPKVLGLSRKVFWMVVVALAVLLAGGTIGLVIGLRSRAHNTAASSMMASPLPSQSRYKFLILTAARAKCAFPIQYHLSTKQRPYRTRYTSGYIFGSSQHLRWQSARFLSRAIRGYQTIYLHPLEWAVVCAHKLHRHH